MCSNSNVQRTSGTVLTVRSQALRSGSCGRIRDSSTRIVATIEQRAHRALLPWTPMKGVHAIYVAIFMVSGAGTRAHAERRIPERSARLLSKLRATPTSPDGRRRAPARLQQAPAMIEQARPPLDPASARALGRRVLGAKMKIAPDPRPAIERDPSWFELPDPAPSKEFRPKVMVAPMGFPTGGGGLKFKFRY